VAQQTSRKRSRQHAVQRVVLLTNRKRNRLHVVQGTNNCPVVKKSRRINPLGFFY
jgi:hypothetical protein